MQGIQCVRVQAAALGLQRANGTERKSARVERKSFPFTFGQCIRCAWQSARMACCSAHFAHRSSHTKCSAPQAVRIFHSTWHFSRTIWFVDPEPRNWCETNCPDCRWTARALRIFGRMSSAWFGECGSECPNVVCPRKKTGQKRFTFTLTLPYNAQQFTIISRLQLDNDRSGTSIHMCVCVRERISRQRLNARKPYTINDEVFGEFAVSKNFADLYIKRAVFWLKLWIRRAKRKGAQDVGMCAAWERACRIHRQKAQILFANPFPALKTKFMLRQRARCKHNSRTHKRCSIFYCAQQTMVMDISFDYDLEKNIHYFFYSLDLLWLLLLWKATGATHWEGIPPHRTKNRWQKCARQKQWRKSTLHTSPRLNATDNTTMSAAVFSATAEWALRIPFTSPLHCQCTHTPIYSHKDIIFICRCSNIGFGFGLVRLAIGSDPFFFATMAQIFCSHFSGKIIWKKRWSNINKWICTNVILHGMHEFLPSFRSNE